MKREEEKLIKRWLKRRKKVTIALIVNFLITGALFFANTQEMIAGGYSFNGGKANGNKAMAAGEGAMANGEQALAHGSDAHAAEQATAIGNNVYARGRSSIAIGNDDVTTYRDKITEYDYQRYFKRLYAEIDPMGNIYSNGNGKMYSPTLAQGQGATAMGSRSLAFSDGSTALGTLAFALKEGATALGTKTRAEGIGAIVMGNGSSVFADYSVATGSKTQVLNQGGMAYGYQAYSAGEGSLAFGREVSANAELLNLAEIKAVFEEDITDITKLTAAGEKAKLIKTETKNGVEGIVTQNSGKNYAIVVGNRAAATSKNSLALGRSAFSLSDNSAAIGSFSYVDAEDAMAIGVGARAFKNKSNPGHTGIAALAIGKYSLATLENSVALGVGSRTDYSIEDLQRAGYTPKGLLSIPTSVKTGVISIGRKGGERRISNLASGYLNTDAVNVGQLRALEEAINLSISEKTGSGLKYLSANKTGGDSAVLEQKMSVGNNYKTYVEYVALKKILSAKKNLNGETIDEEYYNELTRKIKGFETAHTDFKGLQGMDSLDDATTGNATVDRKKYSLLLEELEKKKKEALAKTPAGAVIDNYHNADNSGAKGADSIAIGYDAETSSAAINAVAIGKAAKVNAARGIAIGDGAIVNRADSVAIGKGSRTRGSNAIGYKLDELPEIASSGASAYHSFRDRPNVFTPNMGEFSIGNGETGTRRLTGLAAGIADTDAVNVGQYKALSLFNWRITTDGKPFNRTLKTTSLLKFEGNSDIKTNAEVTADTDKIKFTLSKLNAINEANKNSEQVATSKAVYTAIKDSKASVLASTDGIVTVSGSKTDNIEGNTFTVGIDKAKLNEAVAADFAKKDASNITPNKENWVTALSGDNGLTKSSDYKIAKGIDATAWKNVLGVSNIDLKYKGNGATSRSVPLSTGLTIRGEKANNTEVSGKNIWVESAEAGVLTVKMSEKPNFTEISAGSNKLDATGLTVGTSKVAADGITAGKGTMGGVTLSENQMTGLKAGTQAGNAVEYSQFKEAISNTLRKNASFLVRDDAGANYKVDLSAPSPAITFKGVEKDFVVPGGATTKVKNVTTKIDGGHLVIDLNDKIVLKGASIAGVTFINEDGKKEINAADAKIVNLADGEVSAGSRAAVNGGQLWTVRETAETGKKIAEQAKISATTAQGTANDALSKATTNADNIQKNKDAIAGHTATIADHTATLTKNTTAIEKNTRDIAKGFSFTADAPAVTGESSIVKRALGDSLVIAGDGKNLSTSIDRDAKVIVSLKESPKFGTVTINDAGKITGLSKGTADTDAINLSQLKPIATAVNATIGADGSVSSPRYTLGRTQYNTIQDAFNDIHTKASGKIRFIDGDSKSKEIALGDTIQFKGTNNNLKVALDPTVGSYNFSIIDNPIFSGIVTANGFNANTQKITNVLAGTTDMDAVNYKQLQEVKAGLTTVVGLTLDSPVTYIAMVNGKEEIIKKVGTDFYKAGDLDASGKPKTGTRAIGEDATRTIKISTIAKDGKIASATRFTNVAPGDISDTSEDAINGSQLKPVLDALAMTWDPSNNKIKNPEWQIGNKTFTNIPDVIKGIAKGEVGSLVLTDKNGENIVKAKDSKLYKLSDVNPDTFEPKAGAAEVATTDVRYSALNTTAAPGEGTKKPIQIGNLKEGTEANDAVSLSQLTKLGLNPNAANIKPVVTYDGDTKEKITLAGAEGTKITNLKEGDLSATSKDAVTGKQLHSVDSALKELKANADKGWNLGINAESPQKVAYDDTIQLTSDSNLAITSSKEGTKRTLNIATVSSPTFGKIKLENTGENSVITGLTNKTWDAKNITSGRGATEDQLKSAIENINDSSTEADKFSVKYDKKDANPDYTKITLKNTYDPNVAGSGTKITNLAKGSISENSSDAINASQLYAINKAMANFIGKDAFDSTNGMLKEGFKFPSVTNNGAHAEVNDISTALSNLRYGFRIFGGRGPIGESLDGSAGAMSVGNKENLAILGDDNISTSVTRKKDIKVTRIVKDPVTGEEKTVTDNMSVPVLSIGMTKDPSFNTVLAKKSMTIGDSSNPDTTKRAVIAINSEGAGHIEGLKNDRFNVGLETLNKSNVETALVIDKTRAATENQLSKIVTDYIRRDDENVKYDDANKNKITLNGALTEGVKLSNVGTATEDKDAVNLALLKVHSKATADVIGTEVKPDGSLAKPNFTRIGDKQPTSVVNALTLLGEKITSGTADLDKKLGDPTKDSTDGRNGSLNPDGSNSADGKSGAAGQDGLNGKDVNSKTNALRRGEAGIIVYTTENGLRVGKAKDGKYYELSKIKEDGSPETGATSVEAEKIKHSLVNAKDGLTTSPTVLSNLANGKIAKSSSDAVTGDQLHKVATTLGTVTEDGSLTLKKLQFRGNVSTADYDKTLGEEVRILGNASVTTSEELAKYTAKNVATENTANGVVVKFSDTPEFTSVNATEKLSVGTDGIVLNGKDGANAISFKEGTGSITGLKDLTDAADESSAVNKKFVEDKIKKITGNEGIGGIKEIIGSGADGRGATSGTTGPTGKDGLNGKDLTSKINALRNGEAGTVVYTDKAGSRLYKGNDGKYYLASNIDLKTGVPTGAASEPVRLSLVNASGETTTKTVLDNLENGKIAKDSKEAVNGSQLKDFADKIGLEVDGTDPSKLADPKLTPFQNQFVKDKDGAIYKKDGDKYYKLDPATGNFAKTPIDSITGEKAVEPKLVDRINLLTALNNDLQSANKKGIIFRGDNDDATDNTAAAVSLGNTLKIRGGTENPAGYIGGNIRVESSPEGMKIYTKADPTFESITLNKEGLEKTSAVRLDQLNALRRELKLPPITKKDPDGNGIIGDQRDPAGVYPDPSVPTPGTPGGTNNTVEALKKGEAGPIVYTTETGERLVLGEDKKFYKAEDVKDKVHYKDKWYDGTKVKESNGKLYDIKTGKEVTGNEFAVSAPENYKKEVKLSAVNGKDNSTASPGSIALGNIADGSAGKDATNVDQLNGVRRELGLADITPKDKNGDGKDDVTGSPIKYTGTSPSGPTGVTGGVGSTGATEKDGLAGTKISDKIEYLRNGYAGTVVYTDDAGERIVKGKDDKFYKAKEVNDKVYVDGKWYNSSTFEKYDLKDGKWVDKGKDTLTKEPPKALDIKDLDVKVPSLSLVNEKGETAKPIKLKNVANGKVSKDSTEAVNGSQLEAVYDAIKNTGEGQLIDGKDGKAGIDKDGNIVADAAANKGNTSKDHLNRKSATDKANALRNGEAGTLVYTNAKGDRLFKGNDGKYYTFSDLESNGTPKKDAKAAEKVVSTVVQYDGNTDKPGAIRVAAGEVSETSTEAVNGSQLYEVVKRNDSRFEAQERAITENTKKIETLDTKVNKGLANAAAMSGLSFMEVGTNQASIAAAVGGYKGTQAVAVGVQAAPSENVRVNAKVSMTPGSQSEEMYSVGAAYRFNFR